MSITSEPAFLGNQIDIFGASLQARAPPAKSVITAPALDSRVSSRKKKLTEKGKQFRLELLERKRNSVYLRLKEQITRINKLRESTEIEKEVLETARDNLDDLKDEFHDTHLEHDELLVTEEEREASYRWFDLRDREYTECRIRLCERIQAIEKDLYKSFSDRSSVKSAKSKVSKASSSSQAALSKALVDATAKAAKLQAEMDFLEQERELRRLQLKKAIAIATAEEKAIKGIIEEENNASVKEEVRSVKENIKGENDTKIEKDFSVKDKSERSSIFNQYSPSFMPKASKTAHLTGYEAVDSQPTSYELSTALREIVHLQAKQTELSSLIINQQRINHLPVKEPPVFSGDAFEYPAFVTAFDSIIAANVPSDRDRLYFLEKYTRGKANDVVKGFLAMPSDSAYREARKLLDHRFGNPVHVAEAYKSSLRNWPQIEDGNSSKLQEFSDFLVRCEEAMKCMQSTADIDNTQTLLQVCAKLPSYSGVKWCRYAYVLQAKTKATVKFKNLVDFVREEAELANDPVFSPDALKRERRKTGNYARGRINRPGSMSSKPKPSQSFATSATRSDSTANSSNQYIGNQPCPLCNGNHALSKCNQFLKNTAEERSEIIRNKSLCFRCFRGGHLSAQCPSKSSCEECGKRHNTLLHGAKPRSKTNNQQFTPRKPAFSTVRGPNIEKQLESKSPAVESNSNASSATYNSVNDRPMITNSKIVPVVLFHKDNPEKEVKVYALLDDASDTTFISTKSQHHLGIKGVEMNLNLHTMLGHQEIPVQRIEGLVVQRLDKRAEVELPKTYTRDRIPSRPDQIPKPEVAAKWPHLQRIKDKIPEYEESLEVGLLIGCNCPKAIKPKEVILGKSDEPYAIRTLLGWCVVGPVGELDGEALIDSNSHRILAREVIPNTKDSLSFVLVNPSKEVITPSAINRMFEMDFAEHKRSSQRGLSQEDRRFLEIAEKGIHQCHDGHYELPLPLKNDDVKLPNNKEAALRRLNQLKGRFQSKLNKKYRQDYVTFMNKVIENGYAEKVPEEENQNKPEARRNVWYIPHHGVYHPKKPNKIRVVFDCAAEYKNESLNKHLLQGPDLTNNLTGVLCRFRQEPVAFTCDIEGMFHQVKVNAEHRDLLRFLWWESGDTTKEPQEYRMTVHLFGATSSPGCANFALKHTANNYENVFGTAVANFLRNDFYVDDGLKSVPSIDEAIHLVHNVKQMCSQGGFKLHKFVSNSKDVIRSIPESDRADGVKALDLDLDSLPLERTLGVHWCIESDCFQFSIVLQDKPCTRRGILSTVSSIFDPIGFVAPLLLDGKSILQELCRLQVGWDDLIPDDVKSRWEKWRGELLSLKRISIPRCYKPNNFGKVVNAELHHFSDASIKGYGQCSYLRLTDEHQRIHCSFVMGKSRVAPLKPVTIPRLELTAAVCSVRISQQIRQELEYRIDQECFWTDSKVVLGYIGNESRRYHVFVANRAQEIQESTRTEQWSYIESKENPADEASRGMTAQDLSNSRWINGPTFLWKKDTQRLLDAQASYKLCEDDPEIKKSVAMATATTVNARSGLIISSLAERVEYFSDWHRAKRSVALCMRYVKRLRERVNKTKSDEKTTDLKISDLEDAGRAIIRAVQRKAFKEELDTLVKLNRQSNSDDRSFAAQRNAAIKGHSSLYKLDPFVDESGILRVGGRLKHADLPDTIKFPVILPRRGHVTTLLIKHFHEQTSHQGKGMTLNEIRSNGFWVIGGSSATAYAISSCVKCQKLRGAVQEQRMSDLPDDRVECAPPFTYCAVDYFGPFKVKEGRKELKRYGVLFTCMASRAIHLETANSLETDSFINALRRFISRRGPIRQLRSDQGTNFVGARGELLQALEEMDQDKIKSELQKNQCDWFSFKMNVPSASHMGGVWERQIRSVRSVLSSLLQSSGTQLDDESLRTLMCEAEAIVNSRPLTVDQLSDPSSPGSLTPNHLLTLKSKVVLSPPGVFQSADVYCRKRWRRVQHLANQFWTRWRKEFLLSLQERQKWIRPRRDLRVSDIVIIKEETLPRNKWQLARISAVFPSSDGRVRKVQVALADSCLDEKGKRTASPRFLERPVQKLVLLLPAVDDQEPE